MDRDPVSGGAKSRWPLSLDTRDPEQVASFTLGLGYSGEQVTETLVTRCRLDRVTARSIVNTTLKSHQEGGQS